jgi:hypothetical protein
MKRLLVVLIAALCAGCAAQWGRADHDASAARGDAYVVIGVQPENASISIFQGWISDGKFRQNPLPPASFVGSAEEGFVVTRVAADSAYAITFVTIHNGAGDFLTPPFVPCKGSRTLAFTVPAGKTLYLGNMHYTLSGSGVRPGYAHDFDAAKAFVERHYPGLAPSLTDSQPQFLEVTGNGCVGD